jgi:DNA invertase Pin-like site-specific DNA recombinase
MSSVTISGYKIGYARVSTLEQDEALQRDALLAAGCSQIFVDHASGKLEHRPALDKLFNQLRPGDSVVVWRLDRLGRSLRHLIDVIGDLENRGVAFESLTESIDTSTPAGKLVFHVFASLAQFERELIRERTMAGLAAARARGRKGGRPTVWTDEKLRTAFELYDDRKTDVAGIARILGLSRASVYRALADRDSSVIKADGQPT